MATARKSSPAARPARKAAPAKVPAAAPAPAAAKAAARPASAPAKRTKEEKTRKPKLVRDSFTIPKDEYGVLDELKQRAVRLGSPAKKSELLRAGVKALAAMSDSAFLASLGTVPAIKTGRPAKKG